MVLAIPLVLAITFLGVEIAGVSLQRISLGALIIALSCLSMRDVNTDGSATEARVYPAWSSILDSDPLKSLA